MSPNESPSLRRAAALALGALTLGYPLAVWWSVGHIGPQAVAGALALLALARAGFSRQPMWWAAAAGAGLLAGLSLLGQGWWPLKLYPVLVNALLLAVFGISLRHGPPVVERLARLTEPKLHPQAVAYTRRVTQVWCAFFVLNGGLALATALWASDAVWALYNGLLAYGLIGLLFGVEWLVRQRVKARIARLPLAQHD